jgi:hypothetical protein
MRSHAVEQANVMRVCLQVTPNTCCVTKLGYVFAA